MPPEHRSPSPARRAWRARTTASPGSSCGAQRVRLLWSAPGEIPRRSSAGDASSSCACAAIRPQLSSRLAVALGAPTRRIGGGRLAAGGRRAVQRKSRKIFSTALGSPPPTLSTPRPTAPSGVASRVEIRGRASPPRRGRGRRGTRLLRGGGREYSHARQARSGSESDGRDGGDVVLWLFGVRGGDGGGPKGAEAAGDGRRHLQRTHEPGPARSPRSRGRREGERPQRSRRLPRSGNRGREEKRLPTYCETPKVGIGAGALRRGRFDPRPWEEGGRREAARAGSPASRR